MVGTKLGDSHNPKLTTGTFDMKGRRLITSAADGTVKIWNFSNGQQLKDLLSADDRPEHYSSDSRKAPKKRAT